MMNCRIVTMLARASTVTIDSVAAGECTKIGGIVEDAHNPRHR